MDAKIIGEDQDDIGVKVIDNAGEKHQIELHKSDAVIYAHAQDCYPDHPDDRTREGNEHINQARRFAKYWVYRKRGYDTLAGWQNPDRITLAAIALNTLSPDAAERYLADLFQQLQSLYSDADPAVDVPEGVDPSDVVYQQDVYLGLDDVDAATYAAVLSELDHSELGTETEGPHTTNGPDLEALAAEAGVDPDSLSPHDDGLFIEATSGVHVRWDDTLGEYRTQWGTQPAVEADPDGRIELLIFEPDSITELGQQAVRNLLCQVRDCYLAMGIAPPERFRLLGHGRHDASTWYVHNEFYENYYDPDADIDTWFEEYTPENAYNTTVETESAV